MSSKYEMPNLVRLAEPRPLDDDQVRAAIAKITNWWDTHPHYVQQMETVGRFVRSSSKSYFYTEDGEQKAKIDGNHFEPNRSHVVIIYSGGGDTNCYFPETDGFVDADFLNDFQEGIAAVQETPIELLSNESIVFNSSTSRTIRTIPAEEQLDGEIGPVSELHLVLDSALVGINPPGELGLIFRCDADGKVTRLIQTRMGVAQTSDMTYTIFDTAADVLAEIAADPVVSTCPDPAVRPPTVGAYDEEAFKNILYFRERNRSVAG